MKAETSCRPANAHTSRLNRHVLVAALLLGALADGLLRPSPWGVNFSLWIAALLTIASALVAWHRILLPAGAVWLVLPLVVFAGTFVWRDSSTLKWLNALAIVAALSLATLLADGTRIPRRWTRDYASGLLLSALNAALGSSVLLGEVNWNQAPRATRAGVLGLLMAFPLVLAFGSLFVAADAGFEEMVTNAVRLDIGNLVSHAVLTGFFAWIVGGYLRGTFLFQEPLVKNVPLPRAPRLGIIEVGLPLGLLNILFLIFVLVQLRYLFGDASLLDVTTGLSYADYARRGFFELVTVAALVLPLLLLADWAMRDRDAWSVGIFRTLAGTLLLLLLVIMASAVQRMLLYQTAYGLTELRLYTTAFMAWLGLVFAWFAATVLRGLRGHFASGALIAGLLLVLHLNRMNPDAFIVRVNVARVASGQEFDVTYATSLGGDSVRALIAALPSLSSGDRCEAAARILKRWPLSERPDWRTWNLGRNMARTAVKRNLAALAAMACPEKLEDAADGGEPHASPSPVEKQGGPQTLTAHDQGTAGPAAPYAEPYPIRKTERGSRSLPAPVGRPR